jgi:hypothetical protein
MAAGRDRLAASLQSGVTMATRRTLDGQRGTLPEIRPDGQGVKFLIDVEMLRQTPRLVLRCDSDGNVWASIENDR